MILKKHKYDLNLDPIFDYVFLSYIAAYKDKYFGNSNTSSWFAEFVKQAKKDLFKNDPNILERIKSRIQDFTDKTEIEKIIIKELDIYYKKKKINADFV